MISFVVCKKECLSIVENSKCDKPYPSDYQNLLLRLIEYKNQKKFFFKISNFHPIKFESSIFSNKVC